MAGLVATSILVLSCDAVAAALFPKKRWARSLKVSEAVDGSFGGTDHVSVAWGRVTRAVGISTKFISFLVLLEDSLLWSIEVYSKIIAVQLDDVNRALISGDILTVIVRQESFGDVLDRLHTGNSGELIFFD